jgi:hypothetical protein
MSVVDPSERANIEAIWKAAEALKNSQLPIVRYYALNVLTETSTILNQVIVPDPGTKHSGS